MNDFDAIEDYFANYAKLLAQDPAARYEALRKCSFFQPVADEWVRRFSQMAQIRTFHSDVCITSQDEEMKAFYVILYGDAEAYRSGKRVGTIPTGDCFGEGLFFTDGTMATSATVIADDKIVVAEFNRAAIETLHADPHAMVSFNKALLLALYRKLKGANQTIERLLQV